MNEMIERVAKALFVAHTGGPAERWDSRAVKEDWYPLAHTVLMAIREPTDDMISAGIIERHDTGVPEAWSKATANIYRAMIDTALAT